MSKFFRPGYVTNSAGSDDINFYRETLFFDEEACQMAEKDLSRKQSLYKENPSPEYLKIAVLTELQMLSTILEKERQDSINDIHTIILFQGNKGMIADEQNTALEEWITRISSPEKSEGPLYNMYCRKSYTIPKPLEGLYGDEARESLENAIQELERQNDRIALFDKMNRGTIVRISEIIEDEGLSLKEKEVACLAQIAKLCGMIELAFDESRLETINFWGEGIISGYLEEEEAITERWTEKPRHCGRHTAEEEHTGHHGSSPSWVSDLEKRGSGREWGR